MPEVQDDQILSALGDIGAWQRRIWGLTAIFCVPLSAHIMIMTFMNAKVGKLYSLYPYIEKSPREIIFAGRLTIIASA